MSIKSEFEDGFLRKCFWKIFNNFWKSTRNHFKNIKLYLYLCKNIFWV